MSISLDASMLNINSTTNNFNADKVQNTLNGVNKGSTEDELMEVCKDFSSYFIEEVIKEIEECNKKIEAITGEKVKLLRAPSGDYDNKSIEIAESMNMTRRSVFRPSRLCLTLRRFPLTILK